MTYTFQTKINEKEIIDATFEEIQATKDVSLLTVNNILNIYLYYFKILLHIFIKSISFVNDILTKIKRKINKHFYIYFFCFWALLCYGGKCFLCWLWWG